MLVMITAQVAVMCAAVCEAKSPPEIAILYTIAHIIVIATYHARGIRDAGYV